VIDSGRASCKASHRDTIEKTVICFFFFIEDANSSPHTSAKYSPWLRGARIGHMDNR